MGGIGRLKLGQRGAFNPRVPHIFECYLEVSGRTVPRNAGEIIARAGTLTLWSGLPLTPSLVRLA